MYSEASADGVEEKVKAPYGTWKSPITADVVSGADKRLDGIAVDAHGRLIWLESRPTEAGRAVLVKEPEKPGDEPIDITPKEFGVRTLAQDYGGGAFKVSGDTIIFSNYEDQRLYKQFIGPGDSSPVPLTPDYGEPVVCYADGVFDSRFNRYVTIREDRRESSLNPTTTIGAIGLSDANIQEPKIIASGSDFYAFPRMDPNGERMAWIEWGHPNMPWDKAELWVGYISEDGDIYKRICVVGGDPTLVESPTEPKWSSKGELFFITDRKSGFWNLYKWVYPFLHSKDLSLIDIDLSCHFNFWTQNEGKNEVLAVYSMDAEFTRPLWVFGTSSYDFIQSNEQQNLIACSYRQNGKSYLGIVDDVQNSLSVLDISFTDINNITSGSNCLYIEGASEIYPLSVAKVSLDDHRSKAVDFKIIWSSSPDSTKYSSYFSMPELIEFPTEVLGENAYAYFYPPSNPIYQASPEEKPPLILESHGGPTSEARGILNLSIQYWTSRGWAFVDVNYGGSTGLSSDVVMAETIENDFWGVGELGMLKTLFKGMVTIRVDLVVKVDNGKVDGERLCITGGSAGGYTILASLAFRETFKAGASLYGIADLNSLRAEIPKFESHYIDNLVGKLLNYTSCVSLQIVAPAQSRKIYLALKEKGLPVALVEYEGEQHGFRKAENIKFTLEQQMVFFARLVGHFKVADEITPVRIDNFD
ncbi:hypothetical protein HHK36_002535 [Tetracentron sinense]|uniref:Peptidase S9 prolyl oligopeptidase catalytic domain-containing protein n=1 Tax=Tetracentron sinense TaxID=13715 RepID=A0A834ZMC6_TETSI|nr:hypothetical protein HHK36_002535 [Tetracentron sinense]